MNKFRETEIFLESENISDRVWRHVAGWDDFPRDTIGRELVSSVDSICTSMAESHGHRSRQGRMHYLYTARGSLFKALILLERAARRELGAVKEFVAPLERLAPRLEEYISEAERQEV